MKRQKIHTFVRKYTFLFRLLVSFLLVGMIPILVFTAVNTHKKTEEIRYQTEQQATLVASSVVSQLETCIQSIRKLTVQLANNNYAQLSNEMDSISKERDFIKRMRDMIAGMPMVQEFALCRPKKSASLYSTNGKYQKRIFAQHILLRDPGELDTILSALRQESMLPWSQDIGNSILLLPMNQYGNVAPDTIGVYQFTQLSFSDYFKNTLPRGYAISELYDPNGVLIYRSPYTPVPSLQQLKDQRKIITESQSIYYIGCKTGDSGYQSVVYVPENVLLTNINDYSQLSSIFINLSIAFCALLVVLAMFVSYMPVMRLVKSVRENVESEEYRDEFSLIYDAFSRYNDEVSRISDIMRQQRLCLMDNAYERLLSDRKVSEADLNALPRSKTSFRIAVIRLEDVQDIDVLLEQNKVDSAIFFVELYETGYLAMVCRGDLSPQIINQEIGLPLNDVSIGFSSLSDDPAVMHDKLQEAISNLPVSAQNPDTIKPPSPGKSASVTRLVQYVDSHFSDPDFCITSAATFLGISEHATAKLLRNTYGPNFRRILNEKRIDLAKNLLLSTEDSVNAIGTQVGFMSTSYFIRVFREMLGITPNKFRQANRKSY